MRGRKQCRRRYVVPRDPRTVGQLRARATFAAASKAWSHDPQLTEEQRHAWRVKAAKIQSRPRLAQSGPLTGQQLFVGRRCAGGQNGRWENAADRRQQAEPAPQVPQFEKVAQSRTATQAACAAVAPCQGRRDRRGAMKGEGNRSSWQAPQAQQVTRSTSEQYRSCTGVSRSQYRRSMGWPSHVWPDGRSCLSVEARRIGHRRELWRGS
jgi:hypothetical protein